MVLMVRASEDRGHDIDVVNILFRLFGVEQVSKHFKRRLHVHAKIGCRRVNENLSSSFRFGGPVLREELTTRHTY